MPLSQPLCALSSTTSLGSVEPWIRACLCYVATRPIHVQTIHLLPVLVSAMHPTTQHQRTGDQSLGTVNGEFSAREFLTQAAMFTVIGFVVLNFLSLLVLNTFLNRVLVAFEVWQALDHATTRGSASTIVLGDSVARQIYNRQNELQTGFLHLTTNQAVSMAGQEILLRRAIDNNPRIKRVVLLYVPESYSNDLDQQFTFNYFAKPFCDFSTWSTLTPLVRERMRRRPEIWAAFLPLVKATQLLSNVDYSRFARFSSTAGPHLSEVSVEALRRMQELCTQLGISFELRSPPIASGGITNLQMLRDTVQAAHLDGIFARYFGSIRELPRDVFSDGTHIRANKLHEYRSNWLGL